MARRAAGGMRAEKGREVSYKAVRWPPLAIPQTKVPVPGTRDRFFIAPARLLWYKSHPLKSAGPFFARRQRCLQGGMPPGVHHVQSLPSYREASHRR